MKLNHIRFAQALLLLQSIGSSPSDAFQLQISRKILSPSWTRSRSSTTTTVDRRRLPSLKKQVVAPKADLLWSKFKLSQYRFGISIGSIPRQLQLLTKSKQAKKDDTQNGNGNGNSKEILALVTTCCLSILLRPTSAHAAPTLHAAAAVSSIFLDGPFDELEGLGILPTNCLPGMYFLGFVLRKLVVSVGCLLLAMSLARSAVDRIEYWAVLGDRLWYSRLVNDEEEKASSSSSNASKNKGENESSKVLPNPSMGFHWAVEALGGNSNMEETNTNDAKGKLFHAKHVDWDEYSHTLLSSSQQKKAHGKHTVLGSSQEKKNSQAFVKTLGKHAVSFADMMQNVLCSPDQQLIMSLVVDDNDYDYTAKETQEQEEALIHEAQRYFQEQKNKLHHNSKEQEVFGYYVPKSDSLEDYIHKTSSWREYKGELDKTKVKQDVVANATRKEVSERMNIMKNLLTWDDYKHLVGELQKSKEEVKGKVAYLTSFCLYISLNSLLCVY